MVVNALKKLTAQDAFLALGLIALALVLQGCVDGCEKKDGGKECHCSANIDQGEIEVIFKCTSDADCKLKGGQGGVSCPEGFKVDPEKATSIAKFECYGATGGSDSSVDKVKDLCVAAFTPLEEIFFLHVRSPRIVSLKEGSTSSVEKEKVLPDPEPSARDRGAAGDDDERTATSKVRGSGFAAGGGGHLRPLGGT